jgi:hypothetical protein
VSHSHCTQATENPRSNQLYIVSTLTQIGDNSRRHPFFDQYVSRARRTRVERTREMLRGKGWSIDCGLEPEATQNDRTKES